MTIGKLHSIETFGAVDGPGIRTVFFMQGCPARCLYCHNPDTWKLSGGKEITADEVLETALRSKNYYGEDGGVTFSGGEPLMQGEFILECAKLLKENGIKVVVDTSGTYIDEYTERVIRECQVLLLDIKHSDSHRFSDICACPQENLMSVIKLANRTEVPIWTRQVIVPGINDSRENIDNLADFLKDNIRRLYKAELLGYHTMALNKYERLGMKYKLDGVKPMDKANLAKLQDCLDRDLMIS